MAGPKDQTQIIKKVPTGEAQRIYAPGYLAHKIQNLMVTEEQTLRAVRSGCKYESNPAAAGTFSKNTPGMFHAGLDSGMSDMLLVRSGSKLYRHTGWDRGWEELQSGLSDDARPSYPDQFVVINNKIIWSNGIDRPLVVTPAGSVLPLGFQHAPSAPTALGPQRVPASKKLIKSPNQEGYSAYGRIGTSSDAIGSDAKYNVGAVGTVSANPEASDTLKFSGIVDRLMSARYYYYAQWEDNFGNLSPMSPKSNGVQIFNERTYPNLGVNIEDITRQLLMKTNGDAPENAVAVHIYRTPDVKRVSAKPYRLTRIPGTAQIVYPDNVPDSELGSVAKEYVPVPLFKIGAAYQGRLVIANWAGEPGAIRVSEPGFPGTFESHMYAMPDTGGAEITGIYSSTGGLFAFTLTSMYALEIRPEGILFTPVATGVGCVAPGSLRATKDGGLIWLSADGFMKMKGNQIIPISEPISKTIRSELSKARMRQAQAVVDPDTGEYRCIVTRSGSTYNNMILVFGELGWRRIDLGWHMTAICTTDDDRRLTLIAASPSAPGAQRADYTDGSTLVGTEDSGALKDVTHEVVVFDRERHGNDDFSVAMYDPEVVYRSAWMRADEAALTPINIRMMYLAMLDSEGTVPDVEVDDDSSGYGTESGVKGTTRIVAGNYKIRFFKDGSWKQVSEHRLHGVGVGEDAPLRADSMVIGVDAAGKMHPGAKVTDRRLFWRKVAPELKGVTTWAFEIVATVKNRPHIEAFAFDISTAGTGSPMGRVPHGLDL